METIGLIYWTKRLDDKIDSKKEKISFWICKRKVSEVKKAFELEANEEDNFEGKEEVVAPCDWRSIVYIVDKCILGVNVIISAILVIPVMAIWVFGSFVN